MCPSRSNTEMEILYLFLEFLLHLDQHVFIFDLQPLQTEMRPHREGSEFYFK